MFIKKKFRRKGVGRKILEHLEKWARDLGYQNVILETVSENTEALILYQNYGFSKIPNYGFYQNRKNSVCFGKAIRQEDL